MEDTHIPEFSLEVDLPNQGGTIQVKPDETSDGEPFYVCKQNEETITQLRKDEHNNWEQMWGELDEESIQTIGKAIDQKNQKA